MNQIKEGHSLRLASQDKEHGGEECLGKKNDQDLTEMSSFSEESVMQALELVSWKEFQVNIQAKERHEDKIDLWLNFMSKKLTQEGSIYFKEFWLARKECLLLFKETLNPNMRGIFWKRYIELCDEAKSVKKILDEQSTFAVEQIDLAIKSLVEAFQHIEDRIQEEDEIVFPDNFQTLKGKTKVYKILQKELNFLNNLAIKINALRKELVKTDMRIRYKNDFFKDLSLIGDKIFPRRKELIEKISHKFNSDVEVFVSIHFTKEIKGPLYFFREEIKGFQTLAKILTLNTQVFTQTRTRLSECWDRLKSHEKEWKKEKSKKRLEYKEIFKNLEEVVQKIIEEYGKKNISVKETISALEKVESSFLSKEKDREYYKYVKSFIYDKISPIKEIIENQAIKRNQELLEKEKIRKEALNSIFSNIERLIEEQDNYSLEDFLKEKDKFQDELKKYTSYKLERLKYDPLFKLIRDISSEKREKALMNLPSDDREALKNIRLVLEQRKDRRNEIKQQIENYRKESGKSGLDFKKAMDYNEQVKIEKNRLLKINEGIDYIKKKITQLESQAQA